MKRLLIVMIVLSFALCSCCGKKQDHKPILVFEGQIDRIEVFTRIRGYSYSSRIIMKDGRSVTCYKVPMNPVSAGKTAYIYKLRPRNSGHSCSIFKELQS